MSGFLRSSFVTHTSPCKVLRTATFLLPDFLSMCDTRRVFLWLSKTLRTDLLSLFSKLLISFGILLRSNRIVSTMVIFFLNAHWAMIYTIYKVLYIFVCPRNAIFFIVCFWCFSGIWECMVRIRHNSIT